MKEIKISVRDLVEFIFRQGSIDNRDTSPISGVDGIKAHQRIQRQYKKEDQAEVPLKLQLQFCDAVIKVEGRADGILLESDGYVIDEIKLVAKDLSQIEEDSNTLHWAQAMTYGYIFAGENNLEEIQLQLTYCNFENFSIRQFRKKRSFQELEIFFNDLFEKYKEWLKIQFDWEEKRDISITACEFPFAAYRPGQRELAVRAYKAIEKEKKCFAQAPTGTGKTVSTVFPAIKALGKGLTSKIFYFTAKAITREAAQGSLEMLRYRGLEIKSVTLTAKEKICRMDEANCNPEYCPYANGHFDRVNDAIMELLIFRSNYDRATIEEISESFKVCPFELSLDMSLWADVVICDYNYLFDPRVYLKRFFDVKKTDYTFLVDEAHNLVDRARGMYSAELVKSELFKAKNGLSKKEKKLRDNLNKINRYFLSIKKNHEDNNYVVKSEGPEELYLLLAKFLELGGDYLDRRRKKTYSENTSQNQARLDDTLDISEDTDAKDVDGAAGDSFLEVYFKIYAFMSISEYYDERFVTIYKSFGRDFVVKLYCVDPSKVIQDRLKLGKASILFSATLLPLDYFTELFGADAEDFVINLESPFPKENRLLLIGDEIDTTYKRRDLTAEEIAQYIENCVLAKEGNYMVFLPSYTYMEQIYTIFATKQPTLNAVIQERNMSEEDKENFLALYKEASNNIGFCVLGGHFSEGIDLVADRLIGVIVVGVGMPQIGADRDIIKNYFDEHGKDGFEQSYVFPGLTKVLQATGRCIRAESDKGVIMLLDSRYSQYRYKKLFPREWYPNVRVKSSMDVGAECQKFWDRK